MSSAGTIERLAELVPALGSGDLDPRDLLATLAGRFSEREPALRSFLDENRRAERLEARIRVLERRHPKASRRPPLFGIPFGVKDIFHVDGLETRAGSRVPPEELAGSQSEAVSTLESAGAIVLGKTVTTEFAYFGSGPTRNPHDLDRTPGGSSSGSAAAVAAGLCPLSLGTQTIGSIGRPASYCGIVGFKPSFGRTSTAGVIPLAPSLDHVGFFTHDVDGAERVASVLCNDWSPEMASGGLPTLGVPEGPYLENASPTTLEGFEGTLARLQGSGYQVRRIPVLADWAAIDRCHRRLVAAEAARVHGKWYSRYGSLYQPKTVVLIEQGLEVPDQELPGLRAHRFDLRHRLEALMEAEGVDLWLSPAAPSPAPFGLESTGDPVMNLPWTHAGLPTLSVPAWESESMPMGLQVTAAFGADEALLAWSAGIEEVLP